MTSTPSRSSCRARSSFSLRVHAAARRLLAVAQGGVEDLDPLVGIPVVTCRHGMLLRAVIAVDLRLSRRGSRWAGVMSAHSPYRGRSRPRSPGRARRARRPELVCARVVIAGEITDRRAPRANGNRGAGDGRRTRFLAVRCRRVRRCAVTPPSPTRIGRPIHREKTYAAGHHGRRPTIGLAAVPAMAVDAPGAPSKDAGDERRPRRSRARSRT